MKSFMSFCAPLAQDTGDDTEYHGRLSEMFWDMFHNYSHTYILLLLVTANLRLGFMPVVLHF